MRFNRPLSINPTFTKVEFKSEVLSHTIIDSENLFQKSETTGRLLILKHMLTLNCLYSIRTRVQQPVQIIEMTLHINRRLRFGFRLVIFALLTF